VQNRKNEIATRTGDGRHVRDFVCSMEVDPAEAPWRYIHDGKTYYFCHPRRLSKFRSIPRLYLRAALVSRAGPPTAFVQAKT
jgi:YHS domain-containing protein